MEGHKRLSRLFSGNLPAMLGLLLFFIRRKDFWDLFFFAPSTQLSEHKSFIIPRRMSYFLPSNELFNNI